MSTGDGSFVVATFRLTTPRIRPLDLWEVPDINAIVTNLNSSREDPAYKKLQPVMRECVAGEVQQVMTKLPVKLV